MKLIGFPHRIFPREDTEPVCFSFQIKLGESFRLLLSRVVSKEAAFSKRKN